MAIDPGPITTAHHSPNTAIQPSKDTSKGEFVRLLLKIDITKDGESDRIVEVIEKVLHNIALRVCVDGKADPETPVGQFLAKLRGMPNMHFV